jgi:hypothetical protein
MKKDIEQFVAEHRAEFDDVTVPASLWENVNARLEEGAIIKPLNPQTLGNKNLTRKTHSWLAWMKVAAMVFVACTLGTIIYFYGKSQGYEDYERINPELAASQAVYDELVQQRKDSVRVFANQNLNLEAEFVDALAYMEANYEQLKSELHNSPNQELTLRAMILNLQAQAEVLNQQLYILSKLKSNENETL